MRRLWWILFASLILSACGGGGGNSSEAGKGAAADNTINFKAGGKEGVLKIKAGVMQAYEQDVSDPKWDAAIYGFTLANFDMDKSEGLAKTLTKPDEIRIYFKLYGDPGTNKTAPIKVGTYKADAKEFPKYDPSSMAIFTVEGGEMKRALSQDSPDIDTRGEVKITSVEGDTVKGEINVTTADKIAAKGNFTAKIKPIGY